MTVHYQGKKYSVVRRRYNGPITGYLLGGITVTSPKRFTYTVGYIETPGGIVVVLGVNKAVWVGIAVALILSAVALFPRTVNNYYPVSFEENPVYEDNVLYCNVVNEADQDVTVQFRSGYNATQEYILHAGESLPYIIVDFAPTIIRYDKQIDFNIEVRNE